MEKSYGHRTSPTNTAMGAVRSLRVEVATADFDALEAISRMTNRSKAHILAPVVKRFIKRASAKQVHQKGDQK